MQHFDSLGEVVDLLLLLEQDVAFGVEAELSVDVDLRQHRAHARQTRLHAHVVGELGLAPVEQQVESGVDAVELRHLLDGHVLQPLLHLLVHVETSRRFLNRHKTKSSLQTNSRILCFFLVTFCCGRGSLGLLSLELLHVLLFGFDDLLLLVEYVLLGLEAELLVEQDLREHRALIGQRRLHVDVVGELHLPVVQQEREARVQLVDLAHLSGRRVAQPLRLAHLRLAKRIVATANVN